MDNEIKAMMDHLNRAFEACAAWPGTTTGTYVQYMAMAVALVQLKQKIDYFFHVRNTYVPTREEHVHVKKG